MGFFSKLSNSEKLFQDFSDEEKFELLNWDLSYLTSKKKRREGALKEMDTSAKRMLVVLLTLIWLDQCQLLNF